MESCLLCLELKQEFVGTIVINSKQWRGLNMDSVLLKYLWPMNHINANSWVCQTCWTELYEFHKFYMRIEDAHRNFGLLPTIAAEGEEFASKNEQNATNEIASAYELVEYPIEVIETRAGALKDFINESRNNLQNDMNEDEKPLLKLELCEESISCNNSVPKRKRGRPRKNISNDTDVTKKDYKCNDSNVSRDSAKKADKRKETKCNKSRRKEADIIIENTSSCFKNLKSGLISTSEETHITLEKHVYSSSESDGEYSDHVEIKSAANTNCSSKRVNSEKDKFIAENFKITCHLCDIPFETFYKVRKHFEVEHKQRGHIECCNRKFYRRNMLLDHVHYHVNPNYFKCVKCDKSFEDRRRLDLHIKTHEVNNGKNHFCDVCGKGFLILAILNKHKLIHVPEEEKRFECSDCGKKFATNYCLKTHYRYTHLKKYIKICDTCGKAIRDKDVFKRHMMQHEGKTERVSCDVCGLLLTDEKALKRHKYVIHPVGGQKKYTCSICSKTSPNFRAHKLHVQFKHETGYNYKCTICDKKFKKAPSLKEHMASHTGTTLYNCPWCPKTFNSGANMHHHRKRIHPKEWEETSRKRYSGKLPPYFKPPAATGSPESNAFLDAQ